MDDVAAMRGVERLGELVRDLDDVANRHRPASCGCVQRLAFHVFHDDEQTSVGVSDLMDLADEGVIECGSGERFSTQTLARDVIFFNRFRKNFYGDATFETTVLGEEDLAHSART